MEDPNDTPTQADAAPAPENNQGAPAPANTQQNGHEPSDADGAGEYDPFAALDERGSKLGEDGEIVPAQDSTDEPAADAPPAPEAAAPTDEDEDDANPQADAPREANNFRLNLKDAADGERKRALVRLLKNEPGITLEEANRRVGITAAPPAEAATQEPEAAPPDPLKPLRDEIADLETQEAAAMAEFDYDKALQLGKQLRTKSGELIRQEAVATVETKAKTQTVQASQQQQFETALNSSWADVAKDFPDAGKEGTPLHTALTEAINAKHKANPAFFNEPDWPLSLTLPVARKLGLKPTAPVASAPNGASPTSSTRPAATASAAVAPRKPSVPVAPAPAPGGAASASSAGITVGNDYDPFEALEKYGTKVA